MLSLICFLKQFQNGQIKAQKSLCKLSESRGKNDWKIFCFYREAEFSHPFYKIPVDE